MVCLIYSVFNFMHFCFILPSACFGFILLLVLLVSYGRSRGFVLRLGCSNLRVRRSELALHLNRITQGSSVFTSVHFSVCHFPEISCFIPDGLQVRGLLRLPLPRGARSGDKPGTLHMSPVRPLGPPGDGSSSFHCPTRAGCSLAQLSHCRSLVDLGRKLWWLHPDWPLPSIPEWVRWPGCGAFRQLRDL